VAAVDDLVATAAELEVVAEECAVAIRPPTATVPPAAPNVASRVTRRTMRSPARRFSDAVCSFFITSP
jgi:hypothetical protein